MKVADCDWYGGTEHILAFSSVCGFTFVLKVLRLSETELFHRCTKKTFYRVNENHHILYLTHSIPLSLSAHTLYPSPFSALFLSHTAHSLSIYPLSHSLIHSLYQSLYLSLSAHSLHSLTQSLPLPFSILSQLSHILPLTTSDSSSTSSSHRTLG